MIPMQDSGSMIPMQDPRAMIHVPGPGWAMSEVRIPLESRVHNPKAVLGAQEPIRGLAPGGFGPKTWVWQGLGS